MLNEDEVNISGTGRIDGLLLPVHPNQQNNKTVKDYLISLLSGSLREQPLLWLRTSGLKRFGLLWGMSRWFPTLKLGGPRVDAVVVVGTPVDSFTFTFESAPPEKVFDAPPSVNVAEINRRKQFSINYISEKPFLRWSHRQRKKLDSKPEKF